MKQDKANKKIGQQRESKELREILESRNAGIMQLRHTTKEEKEQINKILSDLKSKRYLNGK